MNLKYPFHINTQGQTATSADDEYIRGLIEQVLFTSPGERVNRPTFGSNAKQLVFAPNNDVVAATTQFTVQGALQQWLGDLIEISDVNVDSEDTTLRVTIQYVIRRTQQKQVAQFTQGEP